MNPFKAVYHAARSFADGVQLGLKIIGWDEPTDIGAEQLCEREAMEEVHTPRCNCLSAERVDEFVDQAIDQLNELLEKFSPEDAPVVVETPTAYPTDLIDAAQILELALDKGDIKPAEYFRPLIARLRETEKRMAR